MKCREARYRAARGKRCKAKPKDHKLSRSARQRKQKNRNPSNWSNGFLIKLAAREAVRWQQEILEGKHL